MPIPANQIQVAEVVMTGFAAAGGSNNRQDQMVFHFRRTAVVNAVTKAGVDAAFQATIATPIAAALNVRYLQANNSVRWVNDAQDAPTYFAHALAGAVAGDGMTTTQAAFILLRTGLRGRNYRGSKHLFPMSEADTTLATDDIFNAAALARLATVAAAILTGFVDGLLNVWVPCVLSRSLSQLKLNPTTVTTNDVNATAVNKRVGVMRHRKVKSVY